MEDVNYNISHSLVYNKSKVEAERDFRRLIQKYIDFGWTVQIMWYMHVLKKSGNSSLKNLITSHTMQNLYLHLKVYKN